jgi:hypothetical protein
LPPNTVIGYDFEDDERNHHVTSEGIVVVTAPCVEETAQVTVEI